jgi:hypothetical protein
LHIVDLSNPGLPANHACHSSLYGVFGGQRRQECLGLTSLTGLALFPESRHRDLLRIVD